MVMADAVKRRQAQRMPVNGREAAKAPAVSRPQLGNFRGGFKAPIVQKFGGMPQNKPGPVNGVGNQQAPTGTWGVPKFGGANKRPSLGAGWSMPGGGGPRAKFSRPNSPQPQAVAPQPQAPAGPVAPDIESYLAGDQVYQLGLSDLLRQLADNEAQTNNSKNSLQSAFSTAMQRMQAERTNAINMLKEDFAGRGLLNSGLVGKAISDYDTEFQNRTGDLNTDLLNQQTGLGTDAQNFKSLVDTERTRLRQDAILRRAAQYGILP